MKPRRQLRLISRYLPRRLLYTVTYGLFIVFLIYFYRKITKEGGSEGGERPHMAAEG
jgi:hypothetical protein